MSLPPRTILTQADPFNDWESEYTRDEPITASASNAKLWSDANAPTTSYTLGSSTSRLPPVQAITGPALTILKRPTNLAASGRNVGTSERVVEKTLEQRKAEYAEAKRRIYGGEELQVTPPGSRPGSKEGSRTNSSTELGKGRGKGQGQGAKRGGNGGGEATRAPRGPTEGGGFGARTG